MVVHTWNASRHSQVSENELLLSFLLKKYTNPEDMLNKEQERCPSYSEPHVYK